MKYPLLIICLLLFISCNNESEQRMAENARDVRKKETIFKNISAAWQFNTDPINPVSEKMMAEWTPWRIFLKELSQKPQSTIGAFRKKARVLSMRVKELNGNIPGQFDKPEIRSRIAVLTTKINSLNLFINLQEIPDQKIAVIVGEINRELTSLQSQMAEIVRKNEIPKELGEKDMIRMLDTARAIPNNPKPTPF